MPSRFKICSCGTRYTVEEWRALPSLGVVDIEREEPAEGEESRVLPFETRRCRVCGSHTSKTVPYQGGTDYPPKS